VIAVIITIMVLELKVPEGSDLHALQPLVPVLFGYVLSFVNIGIYWNNHHHMFAATKKVNGAVLWANMHLLFWLSLIPFTTTWLGEHHSASVPTAVYGVVLLGAGFAYYVLQQISVTVQGPHSVLAAAVGRDLKGKVSVVLYLVAVAVAFVRPWMSDALYVSVALMWLIPDRRIEKKISDASEPGQ
jgi:uncharacterized membrane protein